MDVVYDSDAVMCTNCKVCLNQTKAQLQGGKIERIDAAVKLANRQEDQRSASICGTGTCLLEGARAAWASQDPEGYERAMSNSRFVREATRSRTAAVATV